MTPLGRFLAGAAPWAGWTVARVAADAPPEAFWDAVALGLAGEADALAEVAFPAAPLRSHDLLRVEGPPPLIPGTEYRAHWFVRDDGRTVRLPTLAARLTALGGPFSAPPFEFAGDDWRGAWWSDANAAALARLAEAAGVEGVDLARALAPAVRRAVDALPPGSAPGRLLAAVEGYLARDPASAGEIGRLSPELDRLRLTGLGAERFAAGAAVNLARVAFGVDRGMANGALTQAAQALGQRAAWDTGRGEPAVRAREAAEAKAWDDARDDLRRLLPLGALLDAATAGEP